MTNQERADRRAIFSAITVTGLVEIREVTAMVDQWLSQWVGRAKHLHGRPFRNHSNELEAFIKEKIAVLRSATRAAGRPLNR